MDIVYGIYDKELLSFEDGTILFLLATLITTVFLKQKKSFNSS